MSVAVSFSLNQTDLISVLNNTVATLNVTGLTPNSSTYFRLSFWEGTTQFGEAYAPAISASNKIMISDYLRSYAESKIINSDSISELPQLPIKIKCTLYHTPSGGSETSYVGTGTEDRYLILALVPKMAYYLTDSTSFIDHYNSYLGNNVLHYTSSVKLLTRTEPHRISFLAFKNGISQATFEALTNFRVKYLIIYADASTETVYVTIASPSYFSIVTVRTDFALVESIKGVAKVVTGFNVSIVAFGGSLDTQIAGTRLFRLDPRIYEYERTFCFLSTLSGWQYFSAHGARKVANKSKKETFSSFGNLDNSALINQKQTINIESNQTAIIEIGVDDRKNIAAYQEILDSPLVYLARYDAGGNIFHYPVNILTEKIQSFDDEDYLDSFSFEYEFNFTETSTQDFLK